MIITAYSPIVMQQPAQIYCCELSLIDRLKKWRPDLDESKLELISAEHVTWNNGSLGCPMPGKCYTQALVPGYKIQFQYFGEMIEVHTDLAMQSFAIPGYGFI